MEGHRRTRMPMPSRSPDRLSAALRSRLSRSPWRERRSCRHRPAFTARDEWGQVSADLPDRRQPVRYGQFSPCGGADFLHRQARRDFPQQESVACRLEQAVIGGETSLTTPRAVTGKSQASTRRGPPFRVTCSRMMNTRLAQAAKSIAPADAATLLTFQLPVGKVAGHRRPGRRPSPLHRYARRE